MGLPLTPLRIIGLVLIALGIGLVAVGYASHDSLADQVSETFTGRYTKVTMRYLVGGGVTGAVGVVLALIPGRSKG